MWHCLQLSFECMLFLLLQMNKMATRSIYTFLSSPHSLHTSTFPYSACWWCYWVSVCAAGLASVFSYTNGTYETIVHNNYNSM